MSSALSKKALYIDGTPASVMSFYFLVGGGCACFFNLKIIQRKTFGSCSNISNYFAVSVQENETGVGGDRQPFA
jgi:hypothetical protein